MSRLNRRERLLRRHAGIRKKIFGTPDRPRLFVRRSARHMTACLIDDITGMTLATLTTNSGEFAGGKPGSKMNSAEKLGSMVAEKAKELGIKTVVFDRGGHPYHGRVKALADKAREGGLRF